jgi:long-chain acyl-CoA synthetase
VIATLAEIPTLLATRFDRAAVVRRAREGRFDHWSTADFVRDIRLLGLGLQALGIGPGDRVVIMSDSRPEWLLADLAILAIGAVSVPIYPTLAATQAGYIVKDCTARIAFVADAVQLAKLQSLRDVATSLASLILFDAPADGLSEASHDSVLTLTALIGRGRERVAADATIAQRFDALAASIQPGSLATLIYTSGTTGEPKGVMLTHGNIASNINAIHEVLAKGPDDVALSFLPLSHSFERTVVYSYLTDGVTVAFAESMDTLARDLAFTRPTLMTGVPRVYEKIQARVLEAVEKGSGLRRWLFGNALRRALARVRRAQARGASASPQGLVDTLLDRLVFAKVRARTGGRLRTLVSGSAPLSTSVAEFFAAAGLPIVEGYGLTETSPVVTVNPPASPRFGTVGKALPGVDVRIAPDGEILVRGPNIMKGYWNKPEETAAVLSDGWFHTGDVGELGRDGYLTITDRKKDLLVTSGGKKVAPQPIEARLKANPLVAEAMLIGDRRRFPAVLLVPSFPVLEQQLQALGRPPGTADELTTRPDVVGLYQEIVDALNRDLAQFEQIKKVALLPAEFSVQGGELTPTLKVRRRIVEERWKHVIEAIYA